MQPTLPKNSSPPSPLLSAKLLSNPPREDDSYPPPLNLLIQVVTLATSAGEVVIWDRKEKGGFPGCNVCGDWLTFVETKVLKQLVRDVIQPDRNLGHSDTKGHKQVENIESETSATGREGVGNGMEKSKSEEKTSTVVEAPSQSSEVAGQACEDCQ